jgi:hypothetical protein
MYSILSGTSLGGFYRTGDIYIQRPSQDQAIIMGLYRSSSSNSDTFYISGTAKYTAASGSDNATTLTKIGWDGAAVQYYRGFICEIFAFDNFISDSDYLALLRWTEYKWKSY